MANNASFDELFRAVEQKQEQYLRSLRTLHENIAVPQAIRRRDRADSRVTVQDATYTPPFRAMTGPTFTTSSDAINGTQTQPLPARRSTLDVHERASGWPSPRLLVLGTPVPNSNSGVVQDDDLSSIPPLDLGSITSQPQPKVLDSPRTTQPLLPMSFSDDDILRHMRTADFGETLNRVLEDVDERRGDIDTALSFRDYAAYEREGYLSATFEVYDIAKDAKPRQNSEELHKYGGDAHPFENPDVIVDAPTVWEGLKDVNLDGETVGRITYVPVFCFSMMKWGGRR